MVAMVVKAKWHPKLQNMWHQIREMLLISDMCLYLFQTSVACNSLDSTHVIMIVCN